jgi:hypothetical protein
MGLFLVLCAVVAVGSDAALLGAVAVGSFLVQTHVSTAPVVVLALAAGVGQRFVASRRRVEGAGRITAVPRWKVVAGALAVLAVLWAAPAVEELRYHPGNITRLWEFFTSAHPHHSWGEALRFTAAALRPWSFSRDLLGGRAPGGAIATVVVPTFAAACIALAIASRMLRRRLAMALAVTALVALVAGIAGITRITGPVYRYLVAWMTVLPVVLATGVLLMAAGERPCPAPPVVGLPEGGGAVVPSRAGGSAPAPGLAPLVPALLVVLALSWRLASLPPPQAGNSTTVRQLTELVEGSARPPAGGRLAIYIASRDTWPDVAGLCLQLRRDNWSVVVGPPEWVTIFGRQFQARPGAILSIEVWRQSELQQARRRSTGRLLGSAGSDAVLLLPPTVARATGAA